MSRAYGPRWALLAGLVACGALLVLTGPTQASLAPADGSSGLPALGELDLDASDPLGLAGGDAHVKAEVNGVKVHASPDDLGLFMRAALPGPGFTRPIEAPTADLPVGLPTDGNDKGTQARAIPVPLPEPAEAAVSLGVLAAGLATWAALRARSLGPWFAAPLFSRLERSELLENEVRAKLHDIVQEHPGLSLQDLCERAGAGWGTTVYHLQRLEQAGLVKSRKQGHHRRFYMVGEVDRRDVEALGMLRNATPQKIARYLVDQPGSKQKDVCEALGISPSLAHKYLKRMEEQELLTTERVWRSVHYTPDPKLGDLVEQSATA